MIFRRLTIRSFFDGAAMLACCCLLLLAFVWLRLWIASQIEFGGIIKLFETGQLPKFLTKLLPVSIEALASPLGRTAFGFEEMPVVLLASWWGVARGSDCIVGRVGSGSMEMLLAQPVSRHAVFGAHTIASLAGAAVLGLAAWLSTAVAVATSSFVDRPAMLEYAAAAINFFALTVLMLGIASLAGALVNTRAKAVGWMVGLYFVQVTFKIVAQLSPQYAWLKKLTFLAVYEPTRLTVGLAENPEVYTPLAWQYNGLLLAGGFLGLFVAGTIFCYRDVPAPL